VHSVFTRNERARNRFEQQRVRFLPGTQRRLVNGKSVVIPEEELLQNIVEYKRLISAGAILIKEFNKVIDIDSLSPKHSDVVSNSVPEFRSDSIANDPNFSGMVLNNFIDPPVPSEFEMPVPLPKVDEPKKRKK
jgi:uncharacterized protein YlzI (FlbEa/FlbD family)